MKRIAYLLMLVGSLAFAQDKPQTLDQRIVKFASQQRDLANSNIAYLAATLEQTQEELRIAREELKKVSDQLETLRKETGK